MVKYKVEIRDSVSDHIKREANWRSKCRITIAVIFFGLYLIYFSLGAISGNYIFWGGVLIIVIALAVFFISLYERKHFKKTYEYTK